MARQFTMGARIDLDIGDYTSGMADAVRATQNFSGKLRDSDVAMGRYYDSSGRLREANGRFANSTDKATDSLHKQASAASSLKDKVFSLQNAFTALAGSMAIKGAYNWLIEGNASMEQYQNTLTVVLGSQKEAVETLAWANKFASSTPFETAEIVEATTRMSAYGIEAKSTMGIVGDMASVMGKDLMQAVEAVADAQTGELERLKEFGITKGMIEEQAAAMGKAPFDSKGSLQDQEALNAALFAIMEKRFSGGMEMQSKSFKGMLSNLSDFISMTGSELGKPVFDKMKAGLSDLLAWLEKLKENGSLQAFMDGVMKAASFAGNAFTGLFNIFKQLSPYIAGVGTALLIYNGYLQATVIWTKAVALATKIWNAVTKANPIMLIAIAVGLLIGYLIKLAGGWDVVKAKLIAFLPTLKQIGMTILTAVMPIIKQLQTVFFTVVNAIKTYVLPVLNSIIFGIVAGFQALVGAVRENWGLISAVIQVAWAVISSYLATGIEVVKTLLIGGFKVIGSVLSGVWQMISGVVQTSWSIIYGIVSIGLKLLKGDWKGAWDAMLKMLKGVGEGVGKFFKGLKTTFYDSGKAIIETLTKGIKSVINGPVDAVKAGLEKVREFLPFSDAKKGPLSQLTLNGSKIVTTMAEGIKKQKGALASAMDSVLTNTPQIGIQASATAGAPNVSKSAINPAGTTSSAQNVTKTVTINKLVDKLEISGAEGKNAKQLAQEVIAELYDLLKGADEIEAAGLGGLL